MVLQKLRLSARLSDAHLRSRQQRGVSRRCDSQRVELRQPMESGARREWQGNSNHEAVVDFSELRKRLAEIKGIGEKRLDLVMETVETYLMEGAVEEN